MREVFWFILVKGVGVHEFSRSVTDAHWLLCIIRAFGCPNHTITK